jgi:RIP metalloprotease RseP
VLSSAPAGSRDRAVRPLDGLWRGAVRTWEVSALTLRMIGRMVIGEASLKNLSGPLTIADYAGKSASLGLTPYLLFLALISVSLGVLNLLPLPVLDGGHLMYYLWEAVTGHSVTGCLDGAAAARRCRSASPDDGNRLVQRSDPHPGIDELRAGTSRRTDQE